MSLLRLEKVTIHFGGLMAVDHVSLSVDRGVISSLIGPNGAGKSTVFNIITGIYRPERGKIVFGGQDITRRQPWKITALGIARTFQSIHLFKELSVLDNVKIGRHTKSRAGLFGALTRLPSVGREEKAIANYALEALQTVGLADKCGDQAKNLAYGEQRRLEIARALAAEPKLLLLDEPAAGMNPQEKQTLMEMVLRIRDLGIAIMLVEHDMSFVMQISDHIDVLNYGEKIAGGTPAEIRQNPVVIEAYLGREPA